MKVTVIDPSSRMAGRTVLTVSSAFFLLPFAYAYACGAYVLSFTAFATAAASSNYWRDPVPGRRLSVDLMMAKVDCAVFFLTAYRNVSEGWISCIVWPNAVLIGVLYAASCRAWYQRRPSWVAFHFVFHVTVVLTQLLIVRSTHAYVRTW